MNDAKERLLSEAMKKGVELMKENRELREEATMWHTLFDELLAYHFAHGGDAPNLRYSRTNSNAVPREPFYEVLNNDDYMTVVQVIRR